jgi:Protein of unknown function (DUF2975)
MTTLSAIKTPSQRTFTMTQLVNSAFERHAMQRTSGWLALACLLLIVVLPLTVVAYWAVTDTGLLAVHANMLPSTIETTLKDWQRLCGAALTLLPVALMMRGLWEAHLCFKQFAAGQVFTALAVQRLRSFAGWIIASSLASILIAPLMSIVLTFNNAPGNRHAAIGIGTDHVLTLLFAAVVWVMAGVIAQGQVLAEENSSFV